MSLYVNIEKNLGSFRLCTSFDTEGGVLGILGASGCGKSMTLRCIAGIEKPDYGQIVLDGRVLFDSEKRIHIPPQKRQVGLLFQNYALFPNMTVRQNLMAALLAKEKNKNKAQDKVEYMMQKFYLTGLEEHKPSQLSGGQQQRTALARILLTNPRLLMLDEPFTALDGYLRWNLEMELSDILAQFGGHTLFVSHSRDEIYRMCDRVCVMERGQSSPVIPVKELFEQPQTLAAALLSGCKNYSRAVLTKDGRVFARDWGARLNYHKAEKDAGHIPADISYVGVRSHFLCPVPACERASKENLMRCRILRIVEDVFSMVIMVRPKDSIVHMESNQGQDFTQLRVELSKEAWEQYSAGNPHTIGDEIWIAADSRDVMLLQ